MRRLDTGAKVYLVCGSVFCAVGVLMLFFCGFMAANMDYVMKHGRGDVQLLPLIFGAVGGITTAIGIAVLWWYLRSARKKNRLLEQGEYIIANITGFPRDYRVTVNRRPAYRIECTYQDPGTGIVHVFESGNVFFDPAYYVKADTVRVYIDRNSGYKDYYVDIDSILPEAEWH